MRWYRPKHWRSERRTCRRRDTKSTSEFLYEAAVKQTPRRRRRLSKSLNDYRMRRIRCNSSQQLMGESSAPLQEIYGSRILFLQGFTDFTVLNAFSWQPENVSKTNTGQLLHYRKLRMSLLDGWLKVNLDYLKFCRGSTVTWPDQEHECLQESSKTVCLVWNGTLLAIRLEHPTHTHTNGSLLTHVGSWLGAAQQRQDQNQHQWTGSGVSPLV